MEELVIAVLISVLTISLVGILFVYITSFLVVINNVDHENDSIPLLSFSLPILNSNGLSEAGKKARKSYNKAYVALVVWIVIAFICFKLFSN